MILINKKNKFPRYTHGSIISEAALVIPILIGVSFVIIEFGNVLYLYNSLSQIARTAARYAAVTSSYTQESLISASGASSVLSDVSKLTLNITPAPGEVRNIGDIITVNLQYNYTPVINPFRLFNSNQSWAPVIKSSSVARSEVPNA